MKSLKGLLGVALAAVLLMVMAAAVEVHTEQEWQEALAAKSPEIILCAELTYLAGEEQVIDFDTVLDLGGLSQAISLVVKDGAAVTIKNGSLQVTGALDVYGSGKENEPTSLRIESNVNIVATNGVRLYGPAGGCHLTVMGFIEAKKGACITVAENLSSGDNAVTISGANLNSVIGYAMECSGKAKVTVENSQISGFSGILLQDGTLQITGSTIAVTGANKKNQTKPLDAITYNAKNSAVRLELGEGNIISSANGYALNIKSDSGKILVAGGQFTSEPEKEPVAIPEGLTKETLGIKSGSFSGETSALLPYLAEGSTMDEEGTVTATVPPEREENGIVIIVPAEPETAEPQKNPTTGAPAATVGQIAGALARLAAKAAA